jgi:hypothetical protein
MFDWQNIVVALIVLAALVYVGRRAFRRLRAFSMARAAASSCETGCGKCESTQPSPADSKSPFVQIQKAASKRAS